MWCLSYGAVWPQVFARAQGLLLGLDGVLNVFPLRSSTYRAHMALPLAARVAALRRPAVRAAVLDEYDGAARVISDCHFRKTATEYDRKPGIKWLSCTAK